MQTLKHSSDIKEVVGYGFIPLLSRSTPLGHSKLSALRQFNDVVTPALSEMVGGQCTSPFTAKLPKSLVGTEPVRTDCGEYSVSNRVACGRYTERKTGVILWIGPTMKLQGKRDENADPKNMRELIARRFPNKSFRENATEDSMKANRVCLNVTRPVVKIPHLIAPTNPTATDSGGVEKLPTLGGKCRLQNQARYTKSTACTALSTGGGKNYENMRRMAELADAGSMVRMSGDVTNRLHYCVHAGVPTGTSVLTPLGTRLRSSLWSCEVRKHGWIRYPIKDVRPGSNPGTPHKITLIRS